MDQWIIDATILLLAAFVPSLIYLVWIRNTERYRREPYGRLIRIFVYGATVSVIVAVVLEMLLMVLLDMNIERVYQILGEDPGLSSLILACVIAPFVEEMTKASGVIRARNFLSDIEDGIVYGAAVGLGFAATENLLYESNSYFSDGATAFVATAIVRSLSSALLHATTTSIVGLGVSRRMRFGTSWLPYYLGAVAIHSLFNYAASFGTLYEKNFGASASLIGLFAAFVIALGGISMVRAKIRSLERGSMR